MITRISNVIRPKGSDLIFDHPYDAAEYVRTAPHETAHRSAAQIIRSSTLLVSVNGECDFVVARSYGARLVSSRYPLGTGVWSRDILLPLPAMSGISPDQDKCPLPYSLPLIVAVSEGDPDLLWPLIGTGPDENARPHHSCHGHPFVFHGSAPAS